MHFYDMNREVNRTTRSGTVIEKKNEKVVFLLIYIIDLYTNNGKELAHICK